MKTESMTVEIEFVEPTLGTSPGNKEALSEYIAAKAPTTEAMMEEISVAEGVEKASTVFPRDEQGVFAWDYQWRGFFKEKIFSLIELGECKISKWSYKKAVDLFLFVKERRVRYIGPNGGDANVEVVIPKAEGDLQRPLRATTMQGERVALARSEMLPAGTRMRFTIKWLQPDSAQKKTLATIDRETVVACLDMGRLVGFSQWRGGGWGRFTWREIATA